MDNLSKQFISLHVNWDPDKHLVAPKEAVDFVIGVDKDEQMPPSDIPDSELRTVLHMLEDVHDTITTLLCTKKKYERKLQQEIDQLTEQPKVHRMTDATLKQYQPTDLDSCLAALQKIYEEEVEASPGWQDFPTIAEAQVVGHWHFSVGMAIRNSWNLWNVESPLHKWFLQQGIHHPDDMSGIILTSFHRKLNNKPIGLEDQVKSYKEYWAKQG